MRRSPRRLIPLLVVVVVIGGAYWVQQTLTDPPTSGFSGTLEATNIYLASQMGGRVEEVDAAAGDQIRTGQSLIEIYSPVNGVNEKITSPIDGVLLERLIQPGELAGPGNNLLVVANLDELTLRVFVPEDQYGQIILGQTYPITVDALPGETFQARVSWISDSAAFTPRNVQTIDKRKTTRYAIKLTLTSDGGRLKAGMSAEVNFGATGS